VAYRYFATPRRKFIIADTPGHEQYTRNMATGASTAEAAVVLVDARRGVLQQSRRHAFIAHLLRIPHLVVAVNKMDLVDYRQEIFDAVRAEFSDFTARLGAPEPHYIPISALAGDNVVSGSTRMPWYRGESLLQHLEEVPAAEGSAHGPMRFPVQYVIRDGQDFRGYAGQLASGVMRPGDEVKVLPAGLTTRVKAIVTRDGELGAACAPMSVTVTLEDEIDVGRGDMLVSPGAAPKTARRVEAMMVWMSAKPLAPNRPYLVKQTTRQVRAAVRAIRHRVDVDTLERHEAGALELNEIGAVTLEAQHPLVFDAYERNRTTGSFILIDAVTNETAGAGMIESAAAAETRGRVTAAERAARFGHAGRLVRVNGGMDAAWGMERELFDQGCAVCVVGSAAEAEAATAAGLIAILPTD
jgi:sulfate adenylyltransferase large subunit